MELLVNQSIDLHWKEMLNDDVRAVYVFSPYITSNTAEEVLKKLKPNVCSIHTVFKAELFASRASSLRTLRALLDQGHHLYHVPNLHAKLIFVPETIASIGSQNLTYGGTRNKEASVVISNSVEIDEIQESVLPWLAERTPITLEMIELMEKELPSAENLFDEARAIAEGIDEKVLKLQIEAEEQVERERLRIEHERELVRQSEERQRLLYTLGAKIPRRKLSQETAYCEVIRDYDSFSKRLAVRGNADLSSWSVEGKRINLKRLKRYVCFREDNGLIGWARIAKSRISYINRTLIDNKLLDLGGTKCTLHLTADWSAGAKPDRNLTVQVVTESGNSICRLSVWFDPYGVIFRDFEDETYSPKILFQRLSIQEWINSNWEEFSAILINRVTSPFIYSTSLIGQENVGPFFGKEGEIIKVRLLNDYGGRKVLVVKKL